MRKRRRRIGSASVVFFNKAVRKLIEESFVVLVGGGLRHIPWELLRPVRDEMFIDHAGKIFLQAP
jgi:hypothetical protein